MDLLKFLGNGDYANPILGCTSAFLREGDSLLIIDCGGSAFERILKAGILEGAKDIYVAITHMHSDHVGSLGSLIMYTHYMLEKTINIHFQDKQKLRNYLYINGVVDEAYNFIDMPFKINDKLLVSSINVNHAMGNGCDDCYGYLISDDNEDVIYYSGDCCCIPDIILHSLDSDKMKAIYQDTTSLARYEKNVHMTLAKLKKVIPEKNRHKVYCMHLDSNFNRTEAELDGFNVTRNIFEDPISDELKTTFVTKPILVKAIQLKWENWSQVCEFVKRPFFKSGIYLDDVTHQPLPENRTSNTIGLIIETEDGPIIAKQNDYIIMDRNGNYRICNSESFKMIYQTIL